jgi:UDP-N-acetylmuramoyl-tripeptide--D-alanyl-D-alanine ligase
MYDVPVVAITGSNGKTSTKEMVASVLGTKYAVLKNSGNLNNHLGLPATLLQLADRHEVVVTEMGSNQPGDIGYLCSIARPSCGMITNIGRAHIERLQSREGIAQEKRALFDALEAGGVALVNRDEAMLSGKLPRGVRRISFGTHARSDIRIADVALDARGRAIVCIEAPSFMKRPVTLRLQAVGRHAAYNAAAALAAGFALGCGIRAMQKALEGVRNYDKRTEIRSARGVTVINDTYNANPDSVIAALDLLQQLTVKGSRCIVLGDMLELGKVSAQEHEAIGAALAAAGIPYVFTFGRHSRSVSRAVSGVARHAAHFTDKHALCEALDVLLEEGDTVLVKGSRSMRMEEVVTHLLRLPTSEEANV